MADVWTRFWNAARNAAGLPEAFTPYNARHTGISWAIDKGVDLQKVRQRAGHGSLEVTSPYAAILDERDTSLADALKAIFDGPRHTVSPTENTVEFDDTAGLLPSSTDLRCGRASIPCRGEFRGRRTPETTAVYARVPDGALLTAVRATSGWRP